MSASTQAYMLTGNGAELEPLDTNIFADYKCDIHRAVAYTSRTSKDSPQALQDEKYR